MNPLYRIGEKELLWKLVLRHLSCSYHLSKVGNTIKMNGNMENNGVSIYCPLNQTISPTTEAFKYSKNLVKITSFPTSKMILTILISKDNYQSKTKYNPFWFIERRTITFPYKEAWNFLESSSWDISPMIELMTFTKSGVLATFRNLRKNNIKASKIFL